MLSLYLDEDLQSGSLVRSLREAGFDCLTVNEANMRSHSDLDQLAYAASTGRILVTANTRDFTRIHGDWTIDGRRHAGIVVLTDQQTGIGTIVRAFHRLAELKSAAEIANTLEFLLHYSR